MSLVWSFYIRVVLNASLSVARSSKNNKKRIVIFLMVILHPGSLKRLLPEKSLCRAPTKKAHLLFRVGWYL
jgi:hypothetical protein